MKRRYIEPIVAIILVSVAALTQAQEPPADEYFRDNIVRVTDAVAEQKNLKVGVGLFRRHMQSYLDVMAQLHAGELREIHFLRCYCNMSAWGGGRPRVDGMTEMEHQIRNWRCFDWLGGGRLVEAHCHELDIMDWAMQEHPVEANGMGGRQTITAEMARKGLFGTDYDHHFHEYTYADGTKMYSQCRQMNNCWGPMTEHIHTDKKAVELLGKIRISNVRDRKEEVLTPYLQEHSDLLDAIWNDKPYHEGWFGATSSYTAVLGREASYSGQVVQWDELAEKGPSLFPERIAWDADPPVLPGENGDYEHAIPMPGIYRPIRSP